MITSLRMTDFKNFVDETLRLGPFTLIVGANGSGKSNIRDALRFLHGIGRGYTLAEIVGGKYGADWKPIRGSVSGLGRFRLEEDLPPFALEARMRTSIGFDVDSESPKDATYRIKARPEVPSGGGLSVVSENLQIDSKEVYSEEVFKDREIRLSRTEPALTQYELVQLGSLAFEDLMVVRHELGSMRFFDFAPNRLRESSTRGHTTLGDSGENLPTVLEKICTNHKRKGILIDWVRELTPMDIEDLEFRSDLSSKTHLIIRERNGTGIIAESASDGTLRFLAMLAALLDEEWSSLYFFEEIENGLHPSRLHLLVDLIERQTARGRVQVIATTHSPDLLSMVSDETFKNVAVTCRPEDTNDAIIRHVAELPNAEKLRSVQGLGRLLAGGWMEDILAFTEGSDKEAGE